MAAVIYDLFPAAVLVTPRDPETEDLMHDHTFEMGAARVVVTNEEVLVIIDSPTGPLLALQMPYSPGSFDKAGNHYEYSYVETDTGQVLAFRKDNSCGCGSRLRSFNPYAHIVARG